MSDREAFVSAIAANPSDDLPRLVFADWLDEHGDPARAEFIRTQIRWHHASPDERKQLDARAADLFRDHWQRWFGSFLLALDPHAEPALWYEFRHSGYAGMVSTLEARRPSERVATPSVTRVYVTRGFASLLGVHVGFWGQKGSLSEAFRHEPPHMLDCRSGMHSPDWVRFTEPVLRRVESLTVAQQWGWGVSAPESTSLLEDPHLAGVRQFALYPERNEQRHLDPLPVAWLERFVRSSLAYRLTGLVFPKVTPDGVRPLCRPGRLRLERLALGGELNAESVRQLGESELAGTVNNLELGIATLDDPAAAALAHDRWPKLTQLGLRDNRITAAVLPAMAAAAFTPQLKVLDLSGNPLFTSDERDMARLQVLAEALDPERLEQLNLSDTGLSHTPDFLAERFGDRVTV